MIGIILKVANNQNCELVNYENSVKKTEDWKKLEVRTWELWEFVEKAEILEK